MQAPQHPQEETRLARLRSCGVLDTPREHRFERLVFIAAQIMKTPIAKINFVDADRLWSKAFVGVSTREFARDIAFCSFTILQKDMLVVEDTRVDPRFVSNPLVTGDGLPLGSLCVIDRQPRRVSNDQIRSLKMLAREAEELVYPVEYEIAAAD
jgi:GAF domain-containing protein